MSNEVMNEQKTVAPSKPLKFFPRFFSLLFSPVKLFKNISEFPKIAPPIIMIIIFSIITGVVTYYYMPLVNEQIYKVVYKEYGKEFLVFLQKTTESTIVFQCVITAVTVLSTAILAALMSAVVTLILCKIFKGEAGFKKYFSMHIHIAVISVIGGTLVIGAYVLLNSADAHIFSPAIFFADLDSKSKIYTILTSFSVFTVWTLILASVGIYVISGIRGAKYLVTIFICIVLFLAVPAATAYFAPNVNQAQQFKPMYDLWKQQQTR